MPIAIRVCATIGVILLLPIIVSSAVLAAPTKGVTDAEKNAMNRTFNVCFLALLLDGAAAAIWLIWTTTP